MRDKEFRRTRADGFQSFRELDSYQGLPREMIGRPDGPLGTIGLSPVTGGDFSTFSSCGRGWGTYAQNPAGEREFTVIAGDLDGFTVNDTATVSGGRAAGRKTHR